MMRWKANYALVALGFLVALFLLWRLGGDKTSPRPAPIRPIRCLIEGVRKVECLRDDKDVYFPFERFMKKQFDVNGKFLDGELAFFS